MSRLPPWAEDVIRSWGPAPAWGAAVADPAALAIYAKITARFSHRWSELQADVWPLFGGSAERPEYVAQARHLLALMIDLARYGSRAELRDKRAALDDVARVEAELRTLAEVALAKLELRKVLLHDHLIDGGIDDDTAKSLHHSAKALTTDSWREPRLCNSDFAEATGGRKSARDALNAMLHGLDRLADTLRPVELTDRARAAIMNVAHDTGDAEHYSAEGIKKARADMRKG